MIGGMDKTTQQHQQELSRIEVGFSPSFVAACMSRSAALPLSKFERAGRPTPSRLAAFPYRHPGRDDVLPDVSADSEVGI
jgi:hypothetical protein